MPSNWTPGGAWQKSIGESYDIGIATRDGSTLPCLDRNGTVQNISSLAYVLSASQQGSTQEAIALQRKDQLVRLSSANLIDREFDVWPQASQGTWTGGELQKVFSDASSYYQGNGLLWPVNQVAPMGVVGTQLATGTIGGTQPLYAPVGSGYLQNYGPVMAWATYAAPNYTVSIAGNGNTQTTNAFGVGGAGLHSLQFIAGYLYVVSNLSQNLWYITTTGSGAVTPTVTTGTAALPNNGGPATTGYVANVPYLAVASAVNGGQIRIFNLSTPTSFATYLDVPQPPNTVVQSMCFVGSALYYVLSDGHDVSIQSFDIPSSSSSTVVSMGNYNMVQMTSIAGSVFLVAAGNSANVSNPNWNVDCYLLTGGSLQFATTLPPPVYQSGGAVRYGSVVSISNVDSYGPYALFMTRVAGTTGGGNGTAYVYAYDVVRGALFKVQTYGLGTPSSALWATQSTYGLFYFVDSVVAVQGLSNASPLGNTVGQWAFATHVFSNNGVVNLYAVNSQATPSAEIYSSSIDFTSASVKLYRQIVINHPPLTTGESVSIEAFLDMDPFNLSLTAPSSPRPSGAYWANVSGPANPGSWIQPVTNATVGSYQTLLPLNALARKLVYHVTYTKHAAPISIIVQAGAGWAWQLRLDLARGARTNGQSGAVFQDQGIDEVVAYNFLKQLWRLKGGQCSIQLPNRDYYYAQMQDLRFSSPKPFGASLRSDLASKYETVADLQLREDV